MFGAFMKKKTKNPVIGNVSDEGMGKNMGKKKN